MTTLLIGFLIGSAIGAVLLIAIALERRTRSNGIPYHGTVVDSSDWDDEDTVVLAEMVDWEGHVDNLP